MAWRPDAFGSPSPRISRANGRWHSKEKGSGRDSGRLAPGGLLLYLEESLVRSLLARVDALSAAGSTLLADIIGWTMLWMPPLQPLHDFVRQLGAPWKFGTDEPEELLEPLGWEVTAYDLGTVAAELGRWVWPCSRHPRRAAQLSGRGREACARSSTRSPPTVSKPAFSSPEPELT